MSRFNDLELRCFKFAKEIRFYVKSLNLDITNRSDIIQLVKSSGSIGANYIEANEAVGKKDFLFRLRISRKEAKETAFWLKLILECNDLKNPAKGIRLLNEVTQIRNILSSIIIKAK